MTPSSPPPDQGRRAAIQQRAEDVLRELRRLGADRECGVHKTTEPSCMFCVWETLQPMQDLLSAQAAQPEWLPIEAVLLARIRMVLKRVRTEVFAECSLAEEVEAVLRAILEDRRDSAQTVWRDRLRPYLNQRDGAYVLIPRAVLQGLVG